MAINLRRLFGQMLNSPPTHGGNRGRRDHEIEADVIEIVRIVDVELKMLANLKSQRLHDVNCRDYGRSM